MLRHAIVFVTVVPASADDDTVASPVRAVTKLSTMKIPVKPTVQVIRNDDPAAAILAEAVHFDLLILGLRRSRQGRKTLGAFNRDLAFDAPCAVVLLSRRPGAATDVARPIREHLRHLPWTPRRADNEDR